MRVLGNAPGVEILLLTTATGMMTMKATPYAARTHMEFLLSTIQEGRAIPNVVATKKETREYNSSGFH